jgi:hypothetical protein
MASRSNFFMGGTLAITAAIGKRQIGGGGRESNPPRQDHCRHPL